MLSSQTLSRQDGIGHRRPSTLGHVELKRVHHPARLHLHFMFSSPVLDPTPDGKPVPQTGVSWETRAAYRLRQPTGSVSAGDDARRPRHQIAMLSKMCGGLLPCCRLLEELFVELAA